MRRRQPETGEEGFLLIAVLFILALLLFALATAAPTVSTDLRRDREAETVHRGMQYARAIQLYYRKFGHYPVSIDELVDSNHIKFLRRKYSDPMTGKQDWRLIHVGQSKTMLVGGAAPRIGVPAGEAGQGGPSTTDPNNPFASSGPGVSIGTPIGSPGTPGSPGLPGGQGPGGGIFVGTTPGGDQPPGSPSGPGSPFGGSPGSPRLPGLSSNQPGDAGPGSTAGGGPIVGVSSTNPASAIRILKKMQHYNEWEFIYDPSLDNNGAGGAGGAGGANGLQQPGGVGGTPQNPFQNGPGGSPTPAPPTPVPTPNNPQQ